MSVIARESRPSFLLATLPSALSGLRQSFCGARTSTTGSELFIVDNSDADWKAVRYLHDWCQILKAIDCATGNFEIGALLALDDEWQKVDQFRILMGSEVTPRTKSAFLQAFDQTKRRLDDSIEVGERAKRLSNGRCGSSNPHVLSKSFPPLGVAAL